MEEPTHATFHPFPRLPKEIRNKIWKYTTDEPRHVEVSLRITIGPEPEPDGRFLIHGFDYQSPTPVPALLQVSHEARVEGMKVYDGCFKYFGELEGVKGVAICVYINPEIDTLLLRTPTRDLESPHYSWDLIESEIMPRAPWLWEGGHAMYSIFRTHELPVETALVVAPLGHAWIPEVKETPRCKVTFDEEEDLASEGWFGSERSFGSEGICGCGGSVGDEELACVRRVMFGSRRTSLSGETYVPPVSPDGIDLNRGSLSDFEMFQAWEDALQHLILVENMRINVIGLRERYLEEAENDPRWS